MDVKVLLGPEYQKPIAEIKAQQMTPKIEKVVAFIKNEQTTQKIMLNKGKGLILVEKELIYLIRTEVGKVVAYLEDGTWHETNMTLLQLEETLGNKFVRISKSAIINLDAVQSVKAAFSGTLEVFLLNGLEESISRKYRKDFKNRLGV